MQCMDQLQEPSEPRIVDLFAARRRKQAVAGKAVIRPGDPLPREALLGGALHKQESSFRRRSSTVFPGRSFSREPSQPNIYAHPSRASSVVSQRSGDVPNGQEPVEKKKKTTPGRRGEKRKKSFADEQAETDSRRKRMGKMEPLAFPKSRSGDSQVLSRTPSIAADSSDVFGGPLGDQKTTASSSQNEKDKAQVTLKEQSSSTSQNVTETRNKDSIKKRICIMMEAKGVPRTAPCFKDIYSTTNRGVCFALVCALSFEVLLP